ncbi:MAG: hypothetical protein AB7V50_11130 [Vampirovibrionia bacterium]
MQTDNQTTENTTKNYLQATVGVYPLTPLSVSLYHHYNVERIICKKNGLSHGVLKEKPVLKINSDDEIIEHDINNKFNNGLLECLENKQLPAALLCAPLYNHIDDFVDELIEITLFLSEKELLKGYTNLKRFYFPTIILISGGIVYDEITYKLTTKLKENDIAELIVNNIISKIVRASSTLDAYKDHDIYYPDTKGPIKIALPKFPLFSQVVDILNNKEFKFSIITNPHRIEFDKAMVNIATNSAAIDLSLDKLNHKLRTINIKEAISPNRQANKEFIDNLQKAVFNIGQKAGAFSETETFEKVWLPRKEQLLKEKSFHISASLYNFKNMIKNNNLPEGHLPSEHALIYPLKCYAQHFELAEEFLVLDELENNLLEDVKFAKDNSNRIVFTF